MRTRVTTFEQELATVERDLGQLNVSSAQIKSRDLNDVSCVP